MIAEPPSAHDPSLAVNVDPTLAVPVTAVPPEFVGAVGAARIVNERETDAAVAKSPVEALSAVIVHSPTWFATKVTVAVDTPPDVVELPTVQRPVVEEVNVTAPPEVALAEIEKVCALDDVTRSLSVPKEMLFACPTNTLGSMYILAPKAFPPDAS